MPSVKGFVVPFVPFQALPFQYRPRHQPLLPCPPSAPGAPCAFGRSRPAWPQRGFGSVASCARLRRNRHNQRKFLAGDAPLPQLSVLQHCLVQTVNKCLRVDKPRQGCRGSITRTWPLLGIRRRCSKEGKLKHRGLATRWGGRMDDRWQLPAGSAPDRAASPHSSLTARDPRQRPGAGLQPTARACAAAREPSRSFPIQKLPKRKAGFMLLLIY